LVEKTVAPDWKGNGKPIPDCETMGESKGNGTPKPGEYGSPYTLGTGAVSPVFGKTGIVTVGIFDTNVLNPDVEYMEFVTGIVRPVEYGYVIRGIVVGIGTVIPETIGTMD